MLWETTIASNLGYFAGMMYNQNNVAVEASTVTTNYEIEVGEHMCQMIGYSIVQSHSTPKCWAHVTTGGTISNIEGGWAARNIKYFPVAVATLIRNYYQADMQAIKNYP